MSGTSNLMFDKVSRALLRYAVRRIVFGANGDTEQQGGLMAGRFEIHWEPETGFLFHLTGAEGTVVAVSPPFATIQDTVAGIEAVRENAATGHIVVHPKTKPLLCRQY